MAFDYDKYIEIYNQGDDARTVTDFYTEDVVTEHPGGKISGRDNIIAFLSQAHNGVVEKLKPRVVVRNGNDMLAELDIVLIADRDLPDYFLTPLTKEVPRTIRTFTSYTLQGDRVASFRLAFWLPGS